ncbi:MAG: metallophosphoesterase [Clostridia bacterium]|nr:metallophosphoesterase [Clostridia bacterium]
MIKDKFYCTKCYYLTSEDTPPKECPICHSDRLLFDPVPENAPQFIPEYFKEHLEEKIEKIRERQISAGRESSTFGFVTDLHWASNEKHSAAILEKVMDACGIPYFFTGGDIVVGSGVCPKDSLFRELSEYQESFKRIENKCLMVLGNHDQAYSTFPVPRYYVESLTTDETYEYYFRPQTEYTDRVFGPTLDYYYADDKVHKMRYIALNTHVKANEELDAEGIGKFWAFNEMGIMQEQIEWLASVALDVPSSDWTVCISTHEASFVNMDVILGILDAFRRHEAYEGEAVHQDKPYYNVKIKADFKGRGGDFAVWATGHTHYDKAQYNNDILVTATANDSMHNSANWEFFHVKGTHTEQVIDFFTVDKKAHKVYITRVGAGEDREYDYKVF